MMLWMIFWNVKNKDNKQSINKHAKKMLISSIKAKSHVNMVMRSTTSISTDRLFILTPRI